MELVILGVVALKTFLIASAVAGIFAGTVVAGALVPYEEPTHVERAETQAP